MLKNTTSKKISSKQPTRKKIELDSLIDTEEEFKELYSLGLVIAKFQNLKEKRKRADKELEKIVSDSLKLLKEPKSTINELKKSPFLLMDEFKYKIMIKILRHFSLGHRNKYSKWADRFFKESGLSLFIPKRPKNITQYPWIIYWREEPEELIKLVEKYERLIIKHADLNIEWADTHQVDRLKEAYKKIHGEEFKELSKKFSSRQYALAFISEHYQTPYYTVHKLFHQPKESIQKFIKENERRKIISLENGEIAVIRNI